MKYRLKPEIVERIRTDAKLYGLVADVLGVTPASFIQTLRANARSLTQKGALEVMSKYLKMPERDLLETIEETETA